MNRPSLIERLTRQEDINFLLTNRIPRRLATRLMGWLSRIENPVLCRAGIGIWKAFSDLDLRDARKSTFTSVHDCFTRQLREGARPIDADPSLLTSPCDAIVGATGIVEDGMVLQAKGFPYALIDLLGDPELVRHYQGGQYVTLRLTSGMYHRFHAPYDLRVEEVNYISGDTWNVNPIALRRVERLFCRNERAILRCRLPSGSLLTLVPVAAVLVASIRLHFLDVLLHLRYRGPNVIRCAAPFAKGQEMGWFEHGSTIIVFAPRGAAPCDGTVDGRRIRMGTPLLRLPAADTEARPR
jgi:phosphatidylserine decarboxylase